MLRLFHKSPRNSLSLLLFLIFGVAAFASEQQQQQQQSSSQNHVTENIHNDHNNNNKNNDDNDEFIPPPLTSPFGSYPNVLGLTDEDRKNFHPVIKMPLSREDYVVSDYSSSGVDEGTENLVTEQEHQNPPGFIKRQQRKLLLNTLPRFQNFMRNTIFKRKRNNNNDNRSPIHYLKVLSDPNTKKNNKNNMRVVYYGIGRYDEDRVSMYTSEHYDDLDNQVDGYAGRRTVHMGMDLAGPLGTKVYAFADGILHSAGYNPPLGDYGNVIVIQHDIVNTYNETKTVYALYGHLDAATTLRYRKFHANNNTGKKQMKIKRGQLIGRLGDVYEGGGWTVPHVHFALSVIPPETHDMPGAVSRNDRPKALLQYLDPRYVLGELY